MTSFSISPDYARQLDQQDPLASYREQFVFNDPDLIYLDGNSLGMMPKAAQERSRQVVDEQWGTDLIRGWNKGWWDAPAAHRRQDRPAARRGRRTDHRRRSHVSINLFKLATAALTLQPDKRSASSPTRSTSPPIFTSCKGSQSSLPLPTLGEGQGEDYDLSSSAPSDNDITPDLAALESAIDEDTALVTLSHVVFKSGYLYDMQHITELAHRQRRARPLGSQSFRGCGSHRARCLQRGSRHRLHVQISQRRSRRARLPLRQQEHPGKTLPRPSGAGGDKRIPLTSTSTTQPAPGVQRFLAGTQPMISTAHHGSRPRRRCSRQGWTPCAPNPF